jgi:tyrosinase
MSGIRRRLDAWRISLQGEEAASSKPWHPVLDAYARGVQAMMERGGKANRDTKPDKPLTVDSWLWMANTHGTPQGMTPMKPLWDQCAHHDRYFLTWHRAYLVWFETTIQSLINDPTWALPYWDYSDPAREETLELPWEFRVEQRTVDGVKVDNPLFVDTLPADRPGHPSAGDVDIVEAMSERFFIREFPVQGFGGVDGPWRAPGYLEQTPHDAVHSRIGGLMGEVPLSARDPIFWLHHANIDRLWEVWRKLDGSVDLLDQGGISEQLAAEWRSARFAFGGNGSITVYSIEDVMDTTKPPMNYEYEVTTLPDDIGAMVMTRRQTTREAMIAVDETTPPPQRWDPVAASEHSTSVGEEGADSRLEFDSRQMALIAGGGAEVPSGLIVALMGVRAPVDCHSHYIVEVAAGPGRQMREAGTFATFGLNGTRPEEERNYTIDATRLIAQLVRDGWDGGELLVRVRPESPAADPATAPQGLVIRQITIYRLR